MTLKVLSCLLVILCSVWHTSGTHVDYTELSLRYTDLSNAEFSLLGEYEVTFGIQKVWGKIKEKILIAWNNLVEQAKQTTKNIKQKFENVKIKGDRIIEEAKQKIHEKEIELRTNLKEMAEKAKEVGVDVKECLSEHENEIRDVILTSVAKLGRCVAEKVSEADELAQGIRNIIESAVDIKDIIKDRLDECNVAESAINVPKCLATVAGQIVNEAAKITSEVIQSSKRVKNFISIIQTALPACAAENALSITTSFAKLALNVGVCVKDKMDAARPIDTRLIYLLN